MSMIDYGDYLRSSTNSSDCDDHMKAMLYELSILSDSRTSSPMYDTVLTTGPNIEYNNRREDNYNMTVQKNRECTIEYNNRYYMDMEGMPDSEEARREYEYLQRARLHAHQMSNTIIGGMEDEMFRRYAVPTTREPRFVGGPLDGQLLSEDQQASYTLVWKTSECIHEHRRFNSSYFGSYTDSEYPGFRYTEHVYHRQADGNYHLEVPKDYVQSDEDLIRETKSDKWTMVDRKAMKDLVNNDEWQLVRKNLLKQWKSRPEWCCDRLFGYLGDMDRTTNDKLRIVMNYLTNTAFRTGQIQHYRITNLRKGISLQIAKRKKKNMWEPTSSYTTTRNNNIQFYSTPTDRWSFWYDRFE